MTKGQFEARIRAAVGLSLLAGADFIVLLLIALTSLAIRKNILPLIFHSMPVYAFQPLKKYYWLFPGWIAVLAYNGAYSERFTFWDEVKALWKVTFIVTAAIFAFLFIDKKGVNFSRTFLVGVSLLSLLYFPIMRTGFKRLLYRFGFLRRKMLILGSGDAARAALKAVQTEKNLGYDVAGFIGEDAGLEGLIGGIKVHRSMDKAARYIKRCCIHDVMIAAPDLEKGRLENIISSLQQKAEKVIYMPDISSVAVLGAKFRHFGNQAGRVIEIKNNLSRPVNYVTKRLLDFILAIFSLIIIAVPFLLLVALIKMTSRGPAIFKQARAGRNCRQFMCYKFRTMHMDAEEKLEKLLAVDLSAKQEWQKYRKLKNDPRVTKLGKFLRATSLDELPQIFNVLKGQMSFVGPRPVTQEEIDIYYKGKALFCFRSTPGITGLWQVSGRNETSYEDRIALDMWYVRNWNVWLDIVILLRTIRVVLTGQGAR